MKDNINKEGRDFSRFNTLLNEKFGHEPDLPTYYHISQLLSFIVAKRNSSKPTEEPSLDNMLDMLHNENKSLWLLEKPDSEQVPQVDNLEEMLNIWYQIEPFEHNEINLAIEMYTALDKNCQALMQKKVNRRESIKKTGLVSVLAFITLLSLGVAVKDYCKSRAYKAYKEIKVCNVTGNSYEKRDIPYYLHPLVKEVMRKPTWEEYFSSLKYRGKVTSDMYKTGGIPPPYVHIRQTFRFEPSVFANVNRGWVEVYDRPPYAESFFDIGKNDLLKISYNRRKTDGLEEEYHILDENIDGIDDGTCSIEYHKYNIYSPPYPAMIEKFEYPQSQSDTKTAQHKAREIYQRVVKDIVSVFCK